MTATRRFDYVIVGAGSAGCVLAARLTEDPSVRVLLLEAGGWDRDPWIRIPMGWGRIMQRRLHDWGYDTEPEPHADGRRLECARGKVVGGSSSINAMGWVRGDPSDYDRWAARGLPGWSHAELLPFLKRSEHWEDGDDAWRGGAGPIATRRSCYADPLVDAWIAAARALGLPWTDDYNGAQRIGVARLQSAIRDGRRCSGADAYLRPALRRPNLVVRTHARVARIAIEGGRAVGVETIRGAGTRHGHGQRAERTRWLAEREVLVCAGAFDSPRLLMLSGIGDADALRALGIAPRVALPGVGRNLQDHPALSVAFSRRTPGPMHRQLRADRAAWMLAQAWIAGRGFATDLPSGWVAFLRTPHADRAPDLQLLFNAGTLAARPWLPPLVAPYADGFACRPVALAPASRGRVTLASADPLAPPRIEQNLLADERDRRTLREGVRLVRRIARQAPLAPFIATELAPGLDVESDAALDAFARATAVTAHHPCGTCRMGPDGDPGAVLDAELRVRGVDGLRVIDASSMPSIVGGNINATVVALAERGADLVEASGARSDAGRRFASPRLSPTMASRP